MAVANVGALLAQWGSKVLLIDWDLEAPGLELYFHQSTSSPSEIPDTPGILDLLLSRPEGTTLHWKECVNSCGIDNLDLISAGQKHDQKNASSNASPDFTSYQKRVHKIDWDELYETHDIGRYILDLRSEWQTEYDFILIDSRTGLTDIGDICTVLLPDALIMLFVTNNQNINGINAIVNRARKAHQKLPYDRSRLLVVPVVARDELYSEYKQSRHWKEIAANELGDLYLDWLPKEIQPIDALEKLFIPYVRNWSFGERVPVVEEPHEIINPSSISSAYARLATLLRSKLDWRAIDEEASVYELEEERRTRIKAEATTVLLTTSKDRELRSVKKRGLLLTIVMSLLVLMGTATFSYFKWYAQPAETIAVLSISSREELQKRLNSKTPEWALIRLTVEGWARSGQSMG